MYRGVSVRYGWVYPFLGILFLTSFALAVIVNQPSQTVLHGSQDYSREFTLNMTHGNVTNASLTGFACQGNNCNFSVILDNDNYTTISPFFRLFDFNITNVYYKISGLWRNITELGKIGQGSWDFNKTHVNYTLAGGDGFDNGIRDSLAGGSYWLNETGSLYGKINISNDFITVELTENETRIFNSTGSLLYNFTFNNAVKLDGKDLISTYGTGTQNKTVYFYDWKTQSYKVWMKNGSNTTHGVPDWLDPRFKETFKWRYEFKKEGYPSVNYTLLMTAHGPFVRVFVDKGDTKQKGDSNKINFIESASSTIATSTDTNWIYVPVKKLYYANARHWYFYKDGGANAVKYKTSTDGVSWSVETTVRADFTNAGWKIEVLYDSTNVYYTIQNGTSIFWRRGTPNTDGTITWEPERTVATGQNWERVAFAKDSNGFPWVTTWYESGGVFIMVWNNTATDGSGTWQLQLRAYPKIRFSAV